MTLPELTPLAVSPLLVPRDRQLDLLTLILPTFAQRVAFTLRINQATDSNILYSSPVSLGRSRSGDAGGGSYPHHRARPTHIL